jgi:hypothetical protein
LVSILPSSASSSCFKAFFFSSVCLQSMQRK